jgi:hypothetical protein
LLRPGKNDAAIKPILLQQGFPGDDGESSGSHPYPYPQDVSMRLSKSVISVILSAVILLTMVTACSHKPKDEDLAKPDYLAPKTIYTSKWRKFTVNHPTGFWQVVKDEKWTLLYNNQDAPVQMVIDAQNHFITKPSLDQQLKRFLKTMKAKDVQVTGTSEVTIAGVTAQRTELTTAILFDYWESFKVPRKMVICCFRHGSRFYLMAYISDESNFDKYYPSFETLQKNFAFYVPGKGDSAPGETRPASAK